MDSAKLMFTEAVGLPTPLDVPKGLGADGTGRIRDPKTEQLAKDFESVLIEKLLDQMKDTIGEWGFEQDGPSKQVRGLFWLYMAREMANQGGFGLWRDLHQFFEQKGQMTPQGGLVDQKI
jgi:Rod binding domain-containing protein